MSDSTFRRLTVLADEKSGIERAKILFRNESLFGYNCNCLRGAAKC